MPDILTYMFSKELSNSHPETARFFTNAILKNKLANSYIFIGKDNSKTLQFANNIAKILNCSENKDSINAPCGHCTNCIWLEKNEHPQAFIPVNPDIKSKKEQIKIDSIRELLNSLQITSDFFRVIFFQSSNLNSLPAESCNLLLKTVEETPDRTLFVFANPSRQDILPTILSRSQTIYINKKYDSVKELFSSNTNIQISENLSPNCFSKDKVASLEKADKAKSFLTKNDVDLNTYLQWLAIANYEESKHTYQKRYRLLYENLSNAYQKSKAFIQSKFILEDLFLNLTESQSNF